MKTLLLCTVFLIPSTAWGQFQQNWNYWRGATPQSARLHGQADLVRSQGLYWNLYGDYLIDRESARKQYIKNWTFSTEEYFHRKNINREARFTDPLLLKEQRLNAGFKQLELELKEIELIQKKQEVYEKKKELGLIKEPQIIVKGKTFHSIEDFRKSPEYQEVRAEAKERVAINNIEKANDEERHWQAIKFGQWWNDLSWAQKQKYIQNKNAIRILNE